MDGADRLKSGDHPERRRLAAAGRSDEHHELLVADLQIDVFDSVHAVVELVDPLEDDLSHWSHLPPNRLFAFCMRAFQSPRSGALSAFHRSGQSRDVVLDEKRIGDTTPNPSQQAATHHRSPQEYIAAA